jgi:hypothetical protein
MLLGEQEGRCWLPSKAVLGVSNEEVSCDIEIQAQDFQVASQPSAFYEGEYELFQR